MSKVQKEVEASLKMAEKTIKQFYDRTKRESIQYNSIRKVIKSGLKQLIL